MLNIPSSAILARVGTTPFRFIDLFAGIGGMRVGFEQAGGTCVFSCERDRFARQTYHANFGANEPMRNDVTHLASGDVPKHDVLLAGFPCQPFSKAGVSKRNALRKPHGLDCEAEGAMIHHVAGLLRAKLPQAFLLENVPNLLRHDKGRTFATVKGLLRDAGYHITWRVLNAACVVPQRRKRLFVAGTTTASQFDMGDVEMPSAESGPSMASVLHPDDGDGIVDDYTDSRGRAAAKYGLSEHQWRYAKDYKAKHAAKGNGFGYGLVGPDDTARTLSARYHKDGAEILVDRPRHATPRRLTPRECSRLMGFDAPGESRWVIPVSDTQAYRQFGNAVVPGVVARIADRMAPRLGPR